MANVNATIADKIVAAANSGKEAKFIIDDVEYEFSPTGLLDYIGNTIVGDLDTSFTTESLTVTDVVIFSNLPTVDPGVVGQLWSNSGVLTVSAG